MLLVLTTSLKTLNTLRKRGFIRVCIIIVSPMFGLVLGNIAAQVGQALGTLSLTGWTDQNETE